MFVIPLYDTVVLPGVQYVFRKEYLDAAGMGKPEEGGPAVLLVLKQPKERTRITADDFYGLGVLGIVEHIDEENISVKAQSRIRLEEICPEDSECTLLKWTDCPEADDIGAEEAGTRFEDIKQDFQTFIKQFPWGMWLRGMVYQWKNHGDIVCSLGAHLNAPPEEKYHLLEVDSLRERIGLIEEMVNDFMDMTELSAAAEDEQKQASQKVYREESLKKQIEYLQRQLDEMHPESISDVRLFEQKVRDAGMNQEALREAEKVLARMRREGPDGHEYGILYDYLDFVTGLSWRKEALTEPDLKKAEEILDRDHYGLSKVKNRIIQHLAVMALNKKQSGSILLFVGAPGTGKTSLGQSIAEAMNRPYCRVSLGGVRDEAEIRGHRRTYIGAMPGRIMEGIRRSGGSNPVMVLDEVDKLCNDMRGDPSSALLEVLDPEQNARFTDHYMNVPYDLSDVLFICTANTTETIPEPLLNRMEVISFRGYTAVEKYYIARKHLLPKAMEKTGLKPRHLKVTDEAIRTLIDDYTSESGVRGLKKLLETLCRMSALKLVRGEQKSLTVSPKKLPELLDTKPVHREAVLDPKEPGVVNGLAWTAGGGETLFIETALTEGESKVNITGQLGDVMKESVQIALTLVKKYFPEEAKRLEKNTLHLHVPAGAVPKDGPSAGITMTAALSSLLLGKPVDPRVAMTGEVSLRGNLMPIGGLPEKLMAAQRAGIRSVIIPQENTDDLDDVAAEVKEKLDIRPMKQVREVLEYLGLTAGGNDR